MAGRSAQHPPHRAKPNIHYLDGGHFVLESRGAQVAKLSLEFLKKVYGKQECHLIDGRFK